MAFKLAKVFPYISIEESALGNSNTTFIKVSSQEKDEWQNGIFHNSPYGIFRFGTEKGVMKLELISSGLGTNKFRKCKCKDIETAFQKIEKWMV